LGCAGLAWLSITLVCSFGEPVIFFCGSRLWQILPQLRLCHHLLANPANAGSLGLLLGSALAQAFCVYSWLASRDAGV
jgi:hypothetical protein